MSVYIYTCIRINMCVGVYIYTCIPIYASAKFLKNLFVCAFLNKKMHAAQVIASIDLQGSLCCSVLQCVAVSFSVLQCAAVCCSVLQRVAACCSVAGDCLN